MSRALFVRVRDQAGHARDQEDRVAKLVRESEIRRDRGDRAVDVDRHGMTKCRVTNVKSMLDGADQPYVLAVQLELQRHLKQPRGAGIPSMKAMAEPGRHLAALPCLTIGYLTAYHHGILLAAPSVGGQFFAILASKFTGTALVPLVIALAVTAELLERTRYRVHGIYYAVTGSVLALASLAYAQAPWEAPAAEKAKKNPLPADAKVVDQGQKIAQINCVTCHGAKGKGDGVAAAAPSVATRCSSAAVDGLPGTGPRAQSPWQ